MIYPKILRHLTAYFLWYIAGTLALVFGVAGFWSVFRSNQSYMADDQANKSESLSVVVERATSTSADLGGGVSWSGEVVSATDIALLPPRDGSIREWRVRVGQRVSAGEILGTLAAPLASPERVTMLAERREMLSRARASASATLKFNDTSKKQLLAVRESLENSRGAATKFAEQSSGLLIKGVPPSGTNSVRTALQLKQDKLRSVVLNAIQGHLHIFARNANVNSATVGSGYTYKDGVGALSDQARIDYDAAARKLLTELNAKEVISESSIAAYLDTAQTLAVKSVASEELPELHLSNIRTQVLTDRAMVLDAWSEYEDALRMVELSKSERIKTTSDADTEYAREIAEVEQKIAELDREYAMTVADAKAAEQAYNDIVSGLTNSDIRAPRSGIVAAVFKNVGDFVMPDTLLGTISAGKSQERFIRFRIPGTSTPPPANMKITVTRPGFPLDKVEARVTGVGTVLDANGAYVAEAVFNSYPNWPINASVRVFPTGESYAEMFIPLTAIYWDELGTSRIWIVSTSDRLNSRPVHTGRVVGTKIAIREGLALGEKYAASADPEFREGVLVEEVNAWVPETNTDTTPKKASGKMEMEH